MPSDIKFGATLTFAIPAKIDPKRFEKSVEQRLKKFTEALGTYGVNAIETESLVDPDEVDTRDFESLSCMPDNIIVGAEWFDLEEFLEEHDAIRLKIRIPLVEKEELSRIMLGVRNTLVDQFDSEWEHGSVNDNGTNAIVFIGSEDFSVLSYLCSAPEAQWQASSNQIGDFHSTSLRQEAGTFIMRDMMVLGREAMSPHSAEVAVGRAMGSNYSSLKRLDIGVYSLNCFSSYDLLECAMFDDDELEGRSPGGLKDIMDTLSSFCVERNFSHVMDGFSPQQAHQIERLYDRFAVALSWLRDHDKYIENVTSINHGEFSSEGSSRIAFGYKGELAMFLSQESGFLCVPDDEGGNHFLMSGCFSISDAGVLLPLVALDLAEIVAHPDFAYDPPIKSKAFVTAIRDLNKRLSDMDLIDKWEIPLDSDETPTPS